MPIAERAPLLLAHKKFPCNALPICTVVLACHDEASEDLPSKQGEFLDLGGHVLVPVVDVDNGVELELHAILVAPLRDLEEAIYVLAVFAAAGRGVGGGVE